MNRTIFISKHIFALCVALFMSGWMIVKVVENYSHKPPILKAQVIVPKVEQFDTVFGEWKDILITVAPIQGCNNRLTCSDGFKLDRKDPLKDRAISLSRDQLIRWGGEISFGDLVELRGSRRGYYDGIFTVHDCTAEYFPSTKKRITKVADVYISKYLDLLGSWHGSIRKINKR